MPNVLNTPENWAAARARWESEPKCSFADLTPLLGLSKQAIGKRALKDGWAKKLNLSNIKERAHALADRKSSTPPRSPPKDAGVVDAPEQLSGLPAPAPFVPAVVPSGKTMTPEKAAAAAESSAVDVRAEILKKHRDEWPAVRAVIYKAIKANDLESIRVAKHAAESVKILHDGERKAWGLDTGDGEDGKPMKIVIERQEGVRVVK